MASNLIKKSFRAFFLPNIRLLHINRRDTVGQNEQDWIEENSEKLLEKVKAEKGVQLNIDLSRPQLFFDKSKELQTADEKVKKIVSLEYASAADFKRYEEELIKKDFQQNVADDDSLEIQIAFHTMNIRRMCNNLEEFRKKNRRVKFFLYRQIHRRDRMLAQLFHKNNQRYHWILDKLGLKDYEPKESYPYRRVTKYEKFIKQVQANAEQQRTAKLDALRAEFEHEKKEFSKFKEQELNSIQNEIEQLGFADIKLPTYNKNII